MIPIRHAFLAIAPCCLLLPADAGTKTFDFTGAAQSFVVPPYVTRLTVTARGAEGGSGATYSNPRTPGLGGTTVATIPVTPGETLSINVGGAGGAGGASNDPFFTIPPTAGAGGFNGGGGGGSDVRQGGSALSKRVVVAGGGGGGSSNGLGASGGNGGASTGQAGIDGDAGGGKGGSGTAGGTGGTGGGLPGVSGTGGNGGGAVTSAGGGGGGGYFGGGGGGGSSGGGGGGGGGSSFAISTATGVTMTQGDHRGDGQVVVDWADPTFGAVMKVRKQKSRATFVLTNQGSTGSTFLLSQSIKIGGSKLPKSALKIVTTQAGRDISRAASRGKASVTLAPGALAQVIVKLKPGSKFGTKKRKVRIRMKATGHEASATAKTTLRVRAPRG